MQPNQRVSSSFVRHIRSFFETMTRRAQTPLLAIATTLLCWSNNNNFCEAFAVVVPAANGLLTTTATTTAMTTTTTTTPTRLFQNIYDDWRSDAVVDTMHLDEDNVLDCLEEFVESDYGTSMFGCHSRAAQIGITGSISLVEVCGPEVTLALEGKFWHKRSTVLGRAAMWLNARIPEITDVVVADLADLEDFEEIVDELSGEVIFRKDKRSEDYNGDRATMEYQGCVFVTSCCTVQQHLSTQHNTTHVVCFGWEVLKGGLFSIVLYCFAFFTTLYCVVSYGLVRCCALVLDAVLASNG